MSLNTCRPNCRAYGDNQMSENGDHDDEHDHDNLVDLIIVSSSGDIEDDFPLNQKVQALKTSVMGRLDIDPSKAKQYQLVYDGDPLPGNQTLAELGIADGAEIVLEPEPEVI